MSKQNTINNRAGQTEYQTYAAWLAEEGQLATLLDHVRQTMRQMDRLSPSLTEEGKALLQEAKEELLGLSVYLPLCH